ncbi:MAG: hypothetical protein U1F33_15920 [Alphaproteobacteria bacterium]
MPFIEHDPWRLQYFDGIPCPDDVAIPTDDGDCWTLYPRFRWVHNKLNIAETQGIEAAPHGVVPERFPVFSKPIYNLKGMGRGSRPIATLDEFWHAQAPGHMWMRLLEGEHLSTDVAVIDGGPVWWRHVVGHAAGQGTFDHWTVESGRRTALEAYCGLWLGRHLKGFTGIVNIESIDGRMIEIHLRMSDQWPDLYGAGWVENLVPLYRDGRWTFEDRDRREGYSVVLFGPHGHRYDAVDRTFIAALAKRPAMSSIQITYHEGRSPELHAMPPGGFRLAIINCWDLAVGRAVRHELAQMFHAIRQKPAPARRQAP